MRTTLCALALAAFAVPAFAADADAKPKFGKDDYLPNALANVQSLERFAALAVTKTSDEKIKEFATEVAAAAKKCRQDFEEVIKESKTAVVVGLEKGRQTALTRLALKTGADFDRDYLDQVIYDLQQANEWNKKGVEDTHAKLKDIARKDTKSCKDWLERAEKLKKVKFGEKSDR